MTQPDDPMSRRRFLAGAGGGLVLAALGAGLDGCGSSPPKASEGHGAGGVTEEHGAGTVTGEGASGGPVVETSSTRVVEVEPSTPPPFVHFVSRPDLTPPGVAIRTGSGWDSSPLAGLHIFCAPKNPLAADPEVQHVDLGVGFPRGATPGLMILDTTGELVWFRPVPLPEIPFNFQVQSYRGRPVLTWWTGTLLDGHGVGEYTIADDQYRTMTVLRPNRLPCDLHEFQLTPEGTALHTSYTDHVDVGLASPLTVGHAVEVDVPTNDIVFAWPTYPSVGPERSYVRGPDYFHINSIGLWPGPERDLLVSGRNTSAVYRVERATRRVRWQLGGKGGDFALGDGVRFWFQHDARALADGSGISVFDDASQPCPELYASGKVLRFGGAHRRRAVLVHRDRHTDRLFAASSQGSFRDLPGGGHAIGWGALPYFSVYGPASPGEMGGPLLLDGRLPRGTASYRTFFLDWVGHPPLSELHLVVRRSAGSGSFQAWMSWNGATEVRSWRLEAGRSGGPLALVATIPRRGFESTVRFSHSGADEFVVEALDVSGRVLGRSRPVSAT